MKKLMLIAAGTLFIGGVASYAQDTTGIPASLRSTLSGSQYSGWEKSSV